MLAERGMRAGGECLPASVEGECLPASVLLPSVEAQRVLTRVGAARACPGALIQGPYPVGKRSGRLRRVTTQTLQRWICESCGYIYDPEEGDPDGGIPAGTAFEDIPDTWFCPVCGARKRDFTLYED
jgi:rubredoxin